jgi:hypothetical protein
MPDALLKTVINKLMLLGIFLNIKHGIIENKMKDNDDYIRFPNRKILMR